MNFKQRMLSANSVLIVLGFFISAISSERERLKLCCLLG